MKSEKIKVAVETYGCTMNQADSDMIKGILDGLGFKVLGPGEIEKADVIVLNTCTVKGATENKIIERIKKIEKTKLETKNCKLKISRPETHDTRLVISGCMAANIPLLRKYTSAPIVWPGAIARIGDAVEDALSGQSTEYKEHSDKGVLPRIFTKPILRISIAEGCTGACAFCQTKLARPGLRSISPIKVLEWVSAGVAQGAKEIELTAMDTGAYGLDIHTDLVELLNCINECEGDFLVRLGMINPDHLMRLKKRLILQMKKPKMFKFLHLPVQSGSEKVCKEMNRKHTVAEFEKIVSDFRNAIPDITIATDIIVGYPTETENDFQDTVKLLKRVRPDVVNLSKFSPRTGTDAKDLKQLDSKIIKRRCLEIGKLAKMISIENNMMDVGKTQDILITEKNERGFKGRTMKYKQVIVEKFDERGQSAANSQIGLQFGNGELGERIKVKITRVNHNSLFGTVW